MGDIAEEQGDAVSDESHPARSEVQTVPIEHLTDAVFFVRTSDGRITQANQAAADLYGYEVDELKRLHIQDLVFALEDDYVDPTRNGMITEKGVRFEGTHRRKDGTPFPVESSARLITVNGDGPEVCAMVRDVSESKKTEARLQAAYDELEQIFTLAPDGMRIIDADFNVVRANTTLLEMTGCNAETAIGSKCYETFAGEDCGTPNCPLKRVLDGELPGPREIVKQRCDNTKIETILTVRPFVQGGEVVGIVEAFRDITERKQAEERAHFLATHDPLTWLPNRLLFHDRLSLAVAAAERGHCKPGLLYFDIDDFKSVNDSLGHAAGDDVMRAISEVMQGVLRKGDTAARYGGDEFAVLLPNTEGHQTMEAVAAKLLDSVRTAAKVAGNELCVTISIGATMWITGDTDDDLIQRADEAMYTAKRNGGDQVVLNDG
jgi:diguanylate cyclase (GGDEF)-like protein/PAS domain S-box-containing protein